MKTEILDIKNSGSEKAIERAACILKNGGIVAVPTETVYGLAASAFSDEAIKKVFAAKGRPQDNPLIVHISDVKMLDKVAVNIPKKALELADEFWPGPCTLVLDKNEDICDSVSAGLSTVAVRLPDNEITREVIRASGLPLAAPSANVSGYPSPVSAGHVIHDLNEKIDAVLCGEDCKVGVESTVISLVTNPPRLLRPGAVTVEQLRKILPDLVVDDAVLSELRDTEKAASPGMKYKHYSPKTQVVLVEADSRKFAEYVNTKENSVAVCFSGDSGIEIEKIVYGNGFDEATLAKNIFNVLRQLDTHNYETAYIHAPSKKGIGLAVYNRLIRAAAFKVIKL